MTTLHGRPLASKNGLRTPPLRCPAHSIRAAGYSGLEAPASWGETAMPLLCRRDEGPHSVWHRRHRQRVRDWRSLRFPQKLEEHLAKRLG